ncbi:unnamed protein product, partial [Laminaria digitata]
CEQCHTVYCSNTWVGNPGCFNRDHERGNRRTHTKRGYAHAKEMALKAKQLEKERQEQKERDKRKDGEARVKEKAADKSRTRAAHERQMKWEQRLQKEAKKDLR